MHSLFSTFSVQYFAIAIKSTVYLLLYMLTNVSCRFSLDLVRQFDARGAQKQASGRRSQSEQDKGTRDALKFQGVRQSVELSYRKPHESRGQVRSVVN